jgi:hypothetical protein
VSTNRLVPAFFDGDDRTGAPVFLKSPAEIKALRKSKALEGWYQENGNVFILYRRRTEQRDIERAIAASTMRTAWATKQSGYAGPLVLQMRSAEAYVGV